jgi:hypothetical protein
MTEEQDGLDPSLVKRKLTKRERFRGAVQRGVSKVKKSDEESTRDEDSTLNDDVKDFLAFRSPYSRPTAVPSPTPERQKPDAKPTAAPTSTTDVDEFRYTPDPSDILPHFPTLARDPLPVPRIDVAKSPRFPQARDLLVDNDSADMVSALRLQDGRESATRRKTRRIGLAVRFSDNPPIIIGEGGDEAETPTMYLMHTRARSTSDAPTPERQQYLDQSASPQIPRKPVASPAQHLSPQHISHQSLQSMEFDMTLTPGLSYKTMPIQSTPLEVPRPSTARTRRLRMRAEEGKTLRESFHDALFDSGFE